MRGWNLSLALTIIQNILCYPSLFTFNINENPFFSAFVRVYYIAYDNCVFSLFYDVINCFWGLRFIQ